MDLTFKSNDGWFNCRAAGVIIRDGKLLVMKDDSAPFHYLPGGRIRLHEQSEEAVLREVQEELGAEAKILRLLWIVECFFIASWLPSITITTQSREFHEIAFYYLLELPDQFYEASTGDFTGVEADGTYHNFSWVPLEELETLDFEPSFLKGALAGALPDHTEHIVRRENEGGDVRDESAGNS